MRLSFIIGAIEPTVREETRKSTVHECVVDALTASGFDAYGIAAMGAPSFSFITNVVELVARQGGRVVYRRRDEPDVIAALFQVEEAVLSSLEFVDDRA